MVEAIAIGDRAGELLGRDRVLMEEEPLRRNAAGARLVDSGVDPLALAEAELDEHIGEEATGPATATRRGHPVRWLRATRLRSGC